MSLGSGHFRNIHFPFDIGEDTAIAVASEMVQELDLTDQDVSTIAELIDSEIQSHIPDWISGDNLDIDVSTSNSPVSDFKEDASPLINEFSNLALERLPSGRKYWSDSPKACTSNGNSPLKHGYSNMHSPVDSVNTRGSEGNDNSPGSQEISPRNEDDPNGAENSDLMNGDNLDAAIDLHNRNGAHLFEPEEVKIVVEKLENLLVQQKKELDELKRKHDLEISDVLHELPPAFCQKVLDNCKLKISL